MRLLPALALVLLAPSGIPGAAGGQQMQDDTVVDEIRKDFIDRIQKAEEARDWKGLFKLYHHGLQNFSQHLVMIAPERWTSLREYLNGRMAKLPREAYEFYRFENDGKARAAFEKGRETGSRRDLEKAVEDYFFSSYADEAIDALAILAFDEGRAEEALLHWDRLLRFYPDSEIPRSVTVARLANACRLSENEPALEHLRRMVKEARIAGPVTIAGRTIDIARYVEEIRIDPRPAPVRPPRMPFAAGPEEMHKRRLMGVRNDIRRWTYDFAADRGDATGQAPEAQPPGVRPALRGRRFQMEQVAVPAINEFPLFPAYARVRGKEYVIFSDGSRVVSVDPGRVKSSTPSAGVYWKYPERPIQRVGSGNPGALGRPYLGVTVEGEYAYVPMFSRLEVRPRDAQQMQDGFEGATAIKCLHIPTGKLVWDTDLRPLIDDMRAVFKQLYERNFSFTGAPLVSGDRLFAGISTSPAGEQESRVLCLDKKTGRPLWLTSLASIMGNQVAMMAFGGGRLPVYQTLLTEHGGTLYVQSNLGVVAALSPVSGSIQWLSRYKRAGKRFQNTGGVELTFLRPANAPIVWKGRVYVLAQDRPEMLIYDAITGKTDEETPAAKVGENDLDWKNMFHLIGRVQDWLVMAGGTSLVLNLRTFKAFPLAASTCVRTGRGVIDGDLVYLPISGSAQGNTVGGLGLYDLRPGPSGAPTWKNLEQPPWKDANEYGNLLIAGNYLVVSTGKVTVYTDVETLRSEFAQRLYQSPPHADSLLEFGETMKENDRLEEAAEAYLGFIRAAETEPRLSPKVRQVKGELHKIFLERGDQVAGSDPAKALEFYAYAKGFAFDQKTEAEATRRLAQTYEDQKRWADAVAQYQELIQKGRDLYHRESENVSKLWEHAARKIDAIVAKSPEAYAEVEKQAAEALRKVQQGSVEGLRDVMDRFPNSKTARDAFKRMRDALLQQGRFDKLRSLFDDFKDRFRLDLDFDSYKDLLDLLEKLGDTDRLQYELGRFADRFPAESIGIDGNEESVKDYAERRRVELSRRARSFASLQGPLRRLGEMEAPKPPVDLHGVSVGYLPLRPLGIEPPEFSRDLELFRRGSSVELWDLKAMRRIWARPHPGSYLGVVFGESEAGVPVLTIKVGSPAERAGLRKGDLLIALDGKPIRSSTLTELLAGLAPGSAVEIAYRRGETENSARVELGMHPPEYRPAIVGASFTRDYALAVAWEDGVASLDLVTGEIQWTFRALRERFHVREFSATDGRLYVHEALAHDRTADTFRALPAPGGFKPEEAHHRLFCLSDFSGEVAWARAFDFDPANPNQESKFTFLGPYLSDHVRILQVSARTGNREWVLWIFPSQPGLNPVKRPLVGQVLAHAVDDAGGVFYYVADMMDRRERMLYSVSLDPARKDFKPVEIPLHQLKYMPPTFAVCSLAVDREFLSLVVSPPQMAGEYRIWVFKTADGKEFRSLSLLEGRTLPVNRQAGLGVGRDGLLYVYNVPRDRPATAMTGRAYLTAFRLNGAAGSDPVAWDGLAPVLNHAAGAVLDPEAGNFAVLASTRASLPGDAAESVVAVVYDRGSEGYVRLRHSDLFIPPDAAGDPRSAAAAWRGRLYISARQGLQIFGN